MSLSAASALFANTTAALDGCEDMGRVVAPFSGLKLRAREYSFGVEPE